MVSAKKKLLAQFRHAFKRSTQRFREYAADALLDKHASISYSQQCEDLTVARYFAGRSHMGFYVDVGAHHPVNKSNTYAFYRRGWHGINIDANPDAIQLFEPRRPRDINILAAISESPSEHVYTKFRNSAFNTLDTGVAKAVAAGGQKVVGRTSVKTRPLRSVLDEFIPKDQSIDFLSVDVEGFDLEVLRSNDWTRHRPAVVVVECMDMYQHECFVGIPVYSFLVSQGYTLWACTGGNFVFIDP
jgi:FkbM family methyltransferase